MDKITEDVDVEEEKVNLGKTIWDEDEVEDLGERVIFVNFYGEITPEELKELALKLDMGVHGVMNEITSILESDSLELLIKHIFTQEKELNSFEPILNKIDDIDLHANFSDENDNYIIDINLMAKEECEEEETDDEEE